MEQDSKRGAQTTDEDSRPCSDCTASPLSTASPREPRALRRARLRAFIGLLVAAGMSAGIGVGIYFAATGVSSRWPLESQVSDDQLIACFEEDRAAFQRLVVTRTVVSETTLPSGTTLVAAGSDETSSSALSRKIISNLTADGYSYSKDEALFFTIGTRGWIMGSWEQGYVYSQAPLEPLVSDLGSYEGVYYAYRRIGDGWYLYTYVDP